MLSVVIPCFNEENRVAAGVEQVISYLETHAEPWEILVVDDGSLDDTVRVVRGRFSADPRIRLLTSRPNRGKGWAVREGVRNASGSLVLFSDADLATPIQELSRFLAKAAAGFDLVVASRVLSDSRIDVAQPWRRRLAGAVFRGLVRRLGVTSVRDTQCGFKLMRRETVAPVLEEVTTDRFAFDVEFLSRAERRGLRIAEVGVEWRDRAGSNLRLFPDAVRMAGDLLRIRKRLGPLPKPGALRPQARG